MLFIKTKSLKNPSIYLLLLLSSIFFNCSKDAEPNLNSENKITSFIINGNDEEFVGIINHTTKTIGITTNNLDLSSPITPIIEISKNATISPSATNPQLFNNVVRYTVTAENGDKATYSVTVISSDNKITSFSIKPNDIIFQGEIDHQNRVITIESTGLELNNLLIPEIEISPNATINPSPLTQRDFSLDLEYTVTAQNGNDATYTVITNNTALSGEKQILSFQFDINGDIFEGVINHSNLTIDIETYHNPSNISPTITISDGATISPNNEEPQDFTEDVQYVVTAANQSTNTYTVRTKWVRFYSINSAHNTSNLFTRYYYNATPKVRTRNVDLTVPNSKIILENNQNSYDLNHYNYYTFMTSNNDLDTSFFIEFPQDIVSSTDYKLKYIVDNEVISISDFEIDILVENAPDIISSNQTSYNFNDTLILTGNNLVPGLRIAAHNITIYQYDENYVSVNSNGTELTFPLNVNQSMFPPSSPYPTHVIIFYNLRYGETIILDFN
ncbi:DUF5018 domain-containing protein [Hanstruepera marina]|uniref:DUF5018 domain-containing protein n=1 Tax=Hanstruepera marina TaxID=2873265 RepID=UPI001CA650B7|nr:DUF5018 domain-containing protein [Hanstruepera marina]